MNRYQIEVLTDLDASPEDIETALNEALTDAGCTEYEMTSKELVDDDRRPGHETEFWAIEFSTHHEFTDEQMEEHCIEAI